MCSFHSLERVTQNAIQKTLFYITFVEYHFLSRKCSQKRNFYHVATEQIKVHLQLENKKDWNRFLLPRSEGRKILWKIASSIKPQFSSTTSRDKTPLNWERQQWMMLFHVIGECEIRWMRFAGSPLGVPWFTNYFHRKTSSLLLLKIWVGIFRVVVLEH